jgi:DNA-binding transcriptional ArsR family regulator
VGSASHHLKVLHEAGLVEEVPELAKDRRERWWRLVAPASRWSRSELVGDEAAVAAASAAEALDVQRQFDRAREWLANAPSAAEWDAVAFAAQQWVRATPDELDRLANEVIGILTRWSQREIPDDGAERESVLVFARGFPAQP